MSATDVAFDALEMRPPRKLLQCEVDYFETLTDDEFVRAIESVKTELFTTNLENKVFQNFLYANEPTLLEVLPNAKHTIISIDRLEPLLPLGILPDRTGHVPLYMAMKSRATQKSSFFSDRPPRISISYCTDLVLREIEEIQSQLQKFHDSMTKAMFRLTAEIEEAAIAYEEGKQAIEDFERDVVVGAVDPITQRIPAEKWSWHMSEWLKEARIKTEKFRLRNNSIKMQYSKLKAMLTQKIEIGESLCPVDFEQLYIENKNLLDKIEAKNRHLRELKSMTGKANLNVWMQKNHLAYLTNGLKTMKDAIEETEQNIQQILKETATTLKQLADSEKKYNAVKKLCDNYKVPEVWDYILVKAALDVEKKKLRTLQRKLHITKMLSKSSLRELMHMKGYKKNSLKRETAYGSNTSYSMGAGHVFWESGDKLDSTVSSTIVLEFDIFDSLTKQTPKRTSTLPDIKQ